MQSFHHSRGRIFFEVICAFAISACCAGAWLQTGASALLPAAFVAAIYGLVHAFDMRRPRPTVAAAPRPIEFAPKRETVVPAAQPAFVTPPPTELQLATDSSTDGDKAEPAAAKPSRARRAKAAPKGGRRRATAREEAKVAEIAPLEALKVADKIAPEAESVIDLAPPEEEKLTELPPAETNVTKLTPSEDVHAAEPWRPDETNAVPLTPLFEPKPFVRQQRAAFGRKS